MADIFSKLDEIGAETENALERFMDDKEMYLKYIYNFVEEESMPKLVKAVEDKDYEQAEKSVHALKGIASNLGFLPLADAGIDMLEELRDNNIDEALDAFNDVKKEYEKFTNVINSCK